MLSVGDILYILRIYDVSSVDFTLNILLEMDGIIYYYPSGFWLKIEAKSMRRSSNYPYAVKYSLTLHDPDGKRILGYDNAHKVPGKATDSAYDHRHKGARMISYQYSSADKLLEDFYNDVEMILEKVTRYEYET